MGKFLSNDEIERLRIKFIKRYDFDINRNRTEKILERFDIKKYHFMPTYTNSELTSLVIQLGLHTYVIELDDYRREMVIKRKKVVGLALKKSREYAPIVKKFNKDCIYNSIKWVLEDNKVL